MGKLDKEFVKQFKGKIYDKDNPENLKEKLLLLFFAQVFHLLLSKKLLQGKPTPTDANLREKLEKYADVSPVPKLKKAVDELLKKFKENELLNLYKKTKELHEKTRKEIENIKKASDAIQSPFIESKWEATELSRPSSQNSTNEEEIKLAQMSEEWHGLFFEINMARKTAQKQVFWPT